MASENIETGELEVLGEKIVITTYNGGNPQNIYHLVDRFDIYESVQQNCIVADFVVNDGIELQNYLPIAGEEWISLQVRTPSRKTLTYKFFVHTVSQMKTSDDAMLKVYTLNCVSEDYHKQSCQKISKRYLDKDYQVAINELLKTDFVLSKGLEVEPTKGKFDYLVNNVRPFQIADLLCDRAVSNKYKGTDYLFYEDNEQFRFVTYEYLIEQRKGKAESFKFVYDTANRSKDLDKVINVRNILSYELMSQGHSITKVMDGAQKLQVKEFDLLHGDYFKKNEYTNSSDYSQFKPTDSQNDLNSAAYSSAMEKYPGSYLMAVKDGLRPEMEHNNYIHFKRPWQIKSMQFGMRLRVYADTELLVGDLIQCKFPEISFLSEDRPEQEVYSGNYFVKDIRLSASKTADNTWESFMILDIRRPNLKKALG